MFDAPARIGKVQLAVQTLEDVQDRTVAGIADGVGADLESRRLRTASILPAMIAKETLDCMDVADLKSLRKRIKVPRRRVYSMVFSALTSPKGREMKRT